MSPPTMICAGASLGRLAAGTTRPRWSYPYRRRCRRRRYRRLFPSSLRRRPMPTPATVVAVAPPPPPTATPLPTPVPTQVPVPTLVPTATPIREELLASLRLQAVGLINEARAASGLEMVELVSNDSGASAAQSHADDMMKHNYLGYWWLNGEKAYMVYAANGGDSYVEENAYDIGLTDSKWNAMGCSSPSPPEDCNVPTAGAGDRADARGDYGRRRRQRQHAREHRGGGPPKGEHRRGVERAARRFGAAL